MKHTYFAVPLEFEEEGVPQLWEVYRDEMVSSTTVKTYLGETHARSRQDAIDRVTVSLHP